MILLVLLEAVYSLCLVSIVALSDKPLVIYLAGATLALSIVKESLRERKKP